MFDAIMEAEIRARLKKMGVFHEQVDLVKQLNEAETDEETDAILRRIQNYASTIPS